MRECVRACVRACVRERLSFRRERERGTGKRTACSIIAKLASPAASLSTLKTPESRDALQISREKRDEKQETERSIVH